MHWILQLNRNVSLPPFKPKLLARATLPSVGAELDSDNLNIRQRADGLATFARIDGEESCTPRVVEENGCVHLACHGLPNRKQRFESTFALYDGHFPIQRNIGCDLKNGCLFACHTTVGDEESLDEVIHLASAMLQCVGFRSVTGTMWSVDDGETDKISSESTLSVYVWRTSLVVTVGIIPAQRSR